MAPPVVRVRMRACVRACVRVCVCVCACACVRVYVHCYVRRPQNAVSAHRRVWEEREGTSVLLSDHLLNHRKRREEEDLRSETYNPASERESARARASCQLERTQHN